MTDSYSFKPQAPLYTCQNSQSREFDFAEFALVSMQLCQMNY